MDISSVSGTDIFSYTVPQSSQLESLANQALSNGIDLYTKKNYDGAMKQFKMAVGLSPGSSYAVDACNYMAQTYLQLDDTQGAIDAYKRATKLDSSRDDIHISLGKLYFYDKRYQEAQQEYEQAVKLNPSSTNRFSLGQAYMYNGRYSDAEIQFSAVQNLDPTKPNGYYGLGQNYARQGLYSEAIGAFQKALDLKPDFYDAYAEMGYAYADAGQIDEAKSIRDFIADRDPKLSDTLSSYIYKVHSPQILLAYPFDSSFPYYLSKGTQVSALDAYLENANASKTFTMVFQFDKEMDRESVENPLNWKISRATGPGVGDVYNFGLGIPTTEVQLAPFPTNVYYDSKTYQARVSFTIQQNASADGTIDPSHIRFTFSGKDEFGVTIDPKKDQFSGFSGIA